VLVKGLDDPGKDVRFWCAFALDEMAGEDALSTLKPLALTDRRIVKGFHSVAREAADAVENIEEANKAHRRRGRKIKMCLCLPI
jgi:hypothetical protein